ncbi:MAG: sugar phosphate nucleotidyltransferase [Arcobacteraceae bacterium]|jgi:mannose-1-phosphate guanylyltransferase/phosphomannomutase|nr:sugar phosphate nucleotidyltransferase [Arcobacteraceae bacterium]
MKAIVLAGGFGTRIQPLTNSVPKPMLPILNRPMMEHIIVKLRDELNIKHIAVMLFFKPEIIKNYFKDGSDWGVEITYYLPDDDYGTAGAIAYARDFLDETFIIVSGDLVTNFDFKKIKAFHESKKSKLTITLTSVENPLQFGVVIANKKGEIEKFLEKPSWGEVFSDTINTGIYVLEPEIMQHIPYGQNFDFAKDLFPKLMQEKITLWGCSLQGYWRDVGNPESYREVYKDIFRNDVLLQFKGTKQVTSTATIYAQEGVEIDPKVRLKGIIVLGKNVKIYEGVTLENVCIGAYSKIKKHVELIDCVVWNNVSINTKTKLKNAVICNNNRIDEEVKASLGVIVAENCEINKKVSFERDVVIWPDKIIDEKSVVSQNIIWGDKYKSSIFQAGRVIGRTNIELSSQMAAKLAESFGSILPIGSNVYVSRDYHKSSQMLKRAFLSGMLSTGVNVFDVENVSSNVMRHSLANNDKVIAGIHIRQSVINESETEMIFYTNEALPMDTNLAKSVERIFFLENFRRVHYNQIGDIYENDNIVKTYVEDISKQIDASVLQNKHIKIATDIMFGSTSNIYPKIINELGIESIILNAYKDDKQLQKIPSIIQKSHHDVGKIVKYLNLDCGFLIYPNGQKLQIVCDDGKLLGDYVALLVILELLDKTSSKKIKVFLPAWAPDFIEYANIEITRAKLENFKGTQLNEFDLIANTDGHYAFTQFGFTSDALYVSFKVLELLSKSELKLSSVAQSLTPFSFRGENVACKSTQKGKMMRKFLEEAQDKRHTTADGVKIWLNKKEWILMVPDQHREFLNIYIQAKNVENANKIFEKFYKKIEKWKDE